MAYVQISLRMTKTMAERLLREVWSVCILVPLSFGVIPAEQSVNDVPVQNASVAEPPSSRDIVYGMPC